MIIILYILTTLSLIGLFYQVYDILYPSHFVGDMYGIEILFRTFIIALPVCILILGWILIYRCIKKKTALNILESIMVVISSILLLLLSFNVSSLRYKDKIHDGYLKKSIDELINIAIKEKDAFAIQTIIIKNDPSAIVPLCNILLDEKQDFKLRYESAHALGEIKGESAKACLLKAQKQSTNKMLNDMIQYAINIMK